MTNTDAENLIGDAIQYCQDAKQAIREGGNLETAQNRLFMARKFLESAEEAIEGPAEGPDLKEDLEPVDYDARDWEAAQAGMIPSGAIDPVDGEPYYYTPTTDPDREILKDILSKGAPA